MNPILITSGEPAGVGPDICLDLAQYDYPVVVMGDLGLLEQRAKTLNIDVDFHVYQQGMPIVPERGHLAVIPVPVQDNVIPGQLNVHNAAYVINMLTQATDACLSGAFSALVTAPIHKGVINDAGITFTGHTEFLADRCHAEVVMMLVSSVMRVALVTTHLPLQKVAEQLNKEHVTKVVQIVHQALLQNFGIQSPCLYVSGLNPHAGEGGHLGREEIEIIAPVIDYLKQAGIDVKGPFSADTMFCVDSFEKPDTYIVMYHDQGLPVIKYASFGEAVNVTLGLPMIRTSVDHGTALNLAATGRAHSKSLIEAVKLAFNMAKARNNYDQD